MRVVSLCPSTTETLFDIGAGDVLVGRTKFCVEPSGGVESVPVIGGTKDPRIDRIVDLAPDLVLMNEEENRREDAEALRAAGVELMVTFPRDIPETAAAVRAIGDAVGCGPAARSVADQIDRAFAAAQASAARPIRYAYLIWRRPWMAVGSATFVDALFAAAGGVNVFGGTERYPEFTLAELEAADPEVVLLSSEPFPFAEKHADELAEASGVARDRFRLADGQLCTWHGSRTRFGVPYAAGLLAAVQG